jgi:hypothetical protein
LLSEQINSIQIRNGPFYDLENKMNTDMNDLTQKLIIAMIATTVLFGIFKGTKEMVAITAAFGIALCFANLDKLAKFKTAGLEVELRKAVNDAYAAISQLKDLGVSLSKPIVTDMAVSGRMMEYIPLKYKLEQVANVADTLRKLGASDKEIEETCSTLYERVTNDHLRKVLYTLREANPDKKALFDGLDEGKMDDMDMGKLDNFIKNNALKRSKATDEAILDLDFFLKNKKLRRENEWQS